MKPYDYETDPYLETHQVEALIKLPLRARLRMRRFQLWTWWTRRKLLRGDANQELDKTEREIESRFLYGGTWDEQ